MEERARLEAEKRAKEEEERRKEYSRTLPGLLKDAGKSISSAFSDAGKNIASTTVAAVKSVGGAIKAVGKFFKSDIRLKTDIILIGKSPSGINIYEFRFKSDPSKKYQGVLADELLNTQFENAIYIDADGYYAVDYNKIDVEFKEIEYL